MKPNIFRKQIALGKSYNLGGRGVEKKEIIWYIPLFEKVARKCR